MLSGAGIARALRPHSVRLAMALLGALAIGLCFLPGFDALDYYASLAVAAAGGLLGGFAGVGVAREALRRPEAPTVGAIFARAALSSALLAALPAVILLLDALRVKNCDPLEGLAFYAMGAGCSTLFAGQLGAAAGLATGGRRRGHLLFAAVWLAWIARDLWHLYAEPPISAYDPFVGFFSGAVYDDVIEIDAPFVAFRLLNLLELALLWRLVGMAWDPLSLRVTAGRLQRATRRAWISLVALAIAFGVAYGLRSTIGFERDAADIARALGGELSNDRLVMHYDAQTIDLEEARALFEDHRFRLARVEERLGLHHPRRIHSFVYGSPAQKRALMGGSRVDVARPWLDQIHLNRLSYGDPVLQHELAHVVLGGAAPGPFHVPMRGLAPQMALVEGAAEALEPPNGPLLVHQWAAALRRAHIAPDLLAIMGPGGFWAQPAGKAYVATGSFLAWLLETRGPERFLKAYASGDLEAAYGQPLAELDRAWGAWLDGLTLPEDAIALALQRYDRKAVFSRVCPLEIARLEARIGEAVARGELDRARALSEQVAAFIPGEPRGQMLLASVRALDADPEGVARAVGRLESLESTGEATMTRARELLGDARWRAGDLPGAVAAYAAIAERVQTEDRRRNVLVKRDTAASPSREPILGPYLLGESDDAEAVDYLAEAVADLPGDPLPLYLAARRLAVDRDFEAASRAAASAAPGLRTETAGLGEDTRALLDRENAYFLGVVEIRAGRLERGMASLRRARELTPWAGRRLAIDDWLARARWLGEDHEN